MFKQIPGVSIVLGSVFCDNNFLCFVDLMHAWHCDICLRIETNKSHIHRNIQEHQFAGYHLSHGILSDEQMKIHKSSINPRDLVTTRGFRKTEAFPGQLPGNFRTGQTKRATAREAVCEDRHGKPCWFPHDSHPIHGFSMIFHIWSLVEVGISRLDVILWYSMQFHITCIWCQWCPFFGISNVTVSTEPVESFSLQRKKPGKWGLHQSWVWILRIAGGSTTYISGVCAI